MNQTKIDWGNTQILVPNFRNGDVFYVIYQQEIVAIRLDKSYIETGRNYGQFNLKGVATPADISTRITVERVGEVIDAARLWKRSRGVIEISSFGHS